MRIANKKERIDVRKYMEDMRANRTNRSKLSNPSLGAHGRSYTPEPSPILQPKRPARQEVGFYGYNQEDSRGLMAHRTSSFDRHMHLNEMKNSLTFANNQHMGPSQHMLPNYAPQPIMAHPYYQPQQMVSNFSQASQGPSFSQMYTSGFSQAPNMVAPLEVPVMQPAKQEDPEAGNQESQPGLVTKPKNFSRDEDLYRNILKRDVHETTETKQREVSPTPAENPTKVKQKCGRRKKAVVEAARVSAAEDLLIKKLESDPQDLTSGSAEPEKKSDEMSLAGKKCVENNFRVINKMLLRVQEGIDLKMKTQILTRRTEEVKEKSSSEPRQDNMARMLDEFEQSFKAELAKLGYS